MPTTITDILDSVRDIAGDLLIIASVLLFFIAVLYMSTFYQIVSGVTLFLAVVFLVSGLAIRLEGPLTLTKPSISGFGTILICVSLVAIASIGILMLYTTPTGIRIITHISHGTVTKEMIILSAQPFAWLVAPLATIGLGLLIVGGLLKLRDMF